MLLLVRQKWKEWFDLIASIMIVTQIGLLSFIRAQVFLIWSYRLFFGVSIITLALAGVAINIYMEVIPLIRKRVALIFQKK